MNCENCIKKSKLCAEDKPYISKEARVDLRYDVSEKRYSSSDIGDIRTVFQHDCDSIVYSRSFRRLMHKTQVTFPGTDKNEHTRTRLTHTLEVYRIAHSIGSYLGLNLDLIDAIAFGHDVGHTPFGHEGENFLDAFCRGVENEDRDVKSIKDKYKIKSIDFDFKHNYQSVRVLTHLEGKFDENNGNKRWGLNISKQTLEGILKHSKIYRGDVQGNYYKYSGITDVMENPYRLDVHYCVLSVEGQIVALADEIAQVTHDLEDALTTDYGVNDVLRLSIRRFLNEDIDEKKEKIRKVLLDQGIVYSLNDMIAENIKNHDEFSLVPAYKQILDVKPDGYPMFISWLVGYLVSLSQENILKKINDYVAEKDSNELPYFPLDCEFAGEKVTLSEDLVYNFLHRIEYTYIIKNNRIDRENGKAEYILKSILEAYLNNPTEIPDAVLLRYSRDENISPFIRGKINEKHFDDRKHPNVRYILGELKGDDKKKFLEELRNDPVFLRCVIDGIASMTDQYALNEYKMLYLGDAAYREM